MGKTYLYDFDKVDRAFSEWKKIKAVKKPSLAKKIQDFERVLNYAEEQDVTLLRDFLMAEPQRPLIIFGAGGANSAAVYAASLCNLNGRIAVAKTPMMMNQMSKELLRQCRFLALTASGKTVDVLSTSQRLLRIVEPQHFAAFTLKGKDDNKNKLCKMLNEEYPQATCICYNGKVACTDGSKPYEALFSHDEFVGTKKHLAYFALLYRCFYTDGKLSDLVIKPNEEPYVADLCGKQFSDIKYYTICHGGLGEAVAADLETRLSESSIAFPMVTDYKNFTHGRHAFYNAHQEDTAVIFLETKQDSRFAQEIIRLYRNPKDKDTEIAPLPVIRLQSYKDTPLAAIELLIKSMYLTLDMACELGVNTTSPNAPKLGVWELDYSPYMDYADD